MNLRESIIQILSDKKAKREGLHVKHISKHIFNRNNTFFSDGGNDFDVFKRKVNRILANDVKKIRGSLFKKVINPKTGKYRKGYYQLKASRSHKTKV